MDQDKQISEMSPEEIKEQVKKAYSEVDRDNSSGCCGPKEDLLEERKSQQSDAGCCES